MLIKYKKIDEAAEPPYRGSVDAAGYDIFSINREPVMVPPHETVMFPTGLAIELPPHTFGALMARSSLASKRGLRPAQGVAVIDSDYRGEIKVPLHNDSNTLQIVEPFERICQLVIIPYFDSDGFIQVNELSDTERGEGSFGSTGKF